MYICWILAAVAFRLYDLRQTGYIEREEVGVATILNTDLLYAPLSWILVIFAACFVFIAAERDGFSAAEWIGLGSFRWYGWNDCR